MVDQLLNLLPDLGKAFFETFQMVGISLSMALLFGVPIALILFITDRGLFWENTGFHTFAGVLVNIIRSIPFVILLVILLPLTQRIVKTTIGPLAASVSLSVAAIVFYARLAEASLREVDKGVIEAATAMGAAALTPNSSSRALTISLSSSTVMPLMASMSWSFVRVLSAMFGSPRVGLESLAGQCESRRGLMPRQLRPVAGPLDRERARSRRQCPGAR